MIMKIKKIDEGIEFEISYSKHHGRSYLARLTGNDEKYRFKREFLKPHRKTRTRSRKNGFDFYLVKEDGIYEVSEWGLGIGKFKERDIKNFVEWHDASGMMGKKYFEIAGSEFKEIEKDDISFDLEDRSNSGEKVASPNNESNEPIKEEIIEMKKIGTVVVDTGRLVICDPCNIKNLSPDDLQKDGSIESADHQIVNEHNAEVAVMLQTGDGDGTYHVFAETEMDELGQEIIREIRIQF